MSTGAPSSSQAAAMAAFNSIRKNQTKPAPKDPSKTLGIKTFTSPSYTLKPSANNDPKSPRVSSPSTPNGIGPTPTVHVHPHADNRLQVPVHQHHRHKSGSYSMRRTSATSVSSLRSPKLRDTASAIAVAAAKVSHVKSSRSDINLVGSLNGTSSPSSFNGSNSEYLGSAAFAEDEEFLNSSDNLLLPKPMYNFNTKPSASSLYSVDTSAPNMINQVKNSINSAMSKSDPVRKENAMKILADFRESVDSRRNSTADFKRPVRRIPPDNVSPTSSNESLPAQLTNKLHISDGSGLMNRYADGTRSVPVLIATKEEDYPTDSSGSFVEDSDFFKSDTESPRESVVDLTGKHEIMVDPQTGFPQYPPSINKHIHHQHHVHPHHNKALRKARPSLLRNKTDDAMADYSDSGSFQQPKVQLKTTMRKEKKKSKSNFNEDKPWKNHSELTYITDQERKRYEGVWVTNKGLLLAKVMTVLEGVDYSQVVLPASIEDHSTTAAKLSSMKGPTIEINQLIHGLVVREIWKRSRLPDETLSKIWGLVDRRCDGTLDREEFIVGMWLVDQCLYGRKLPKDVEESVWQSVAKMGLNVVNVRKKVMGRIRK